jgi:hypothetical protein
MSPYCDAWAQGKILHLLAPRALQMHNLTIYILSTCRQNPTVEQWNADRKFAAQKYPEVQECPDLH